MPTTQQNQKTTQDIDAILNAAVDSYDTPVDPEIEELIAEADEEDIEDDAIIEVDEMAELEELTISAAPNVDEELDDDALRALDAATERAAAYEDQSSVAVATIDPAEQSKKRKKAPKTPKAPGTPRAARDMASVPAEFFVLTGDVASMDDAAKDAAKVATIALLPTQVKIAEKFENLFVALGAGKAPSRYTVDAFSLIDKQKDVTSSDIVAAYKAQGLNDGTARSQAGQIMKLFDTTGVATRSGNALKLVDDSVVAERLRNLSVAAA